MLKKKIIFTILAAFLTAALSIQPAYAEQTAFTIEDSLRVKSIQVHDITDDGRYIAAVIRSRGDRIGIDHKRFRDPTYEAPAHLSPVIIDAQTRQFIPIFKQKVHISDMTWSPDNTSLAFFLLDKGRTSLHLFSLRDSQITRIQLKTAQPISSNSPLVWTNDGKRVMVCLRDKNWEQVSRDMFLEATEGPVIIYDSRQPFLKWDKIRDQGMLEIPASVNLETGEVTELLPESRYSSLRISHDDSFLCFEEIFPVKTEYGENYYREGGREYALYRLNLPPENEPHALISKKDKRLNLYWNQKNTRFAWSDEGNIFIQSADEAEPRNITEKITAKKKEKESAETSGEGPRFSVVRWSPEGKHVLAKTKQGFWLFDSNTGEGEQVYQFPEEQDEEYQRGDPRPPSVEAWSPDGRYLYMTYSAADKWERGYTRFDLQSRTMDDLIIDQNLYRDLRMSEDGSRFFYQFSDGDHPNELFAADPEFQKPIRLTDLNPWIDNKKLTRSELFSYLDVDGNKLYGILYYPVDYNPEKKYPLVCEIYEKFFDNGFHAGMNILANQGFFGVRPSVNLEIGHPGEAWVKGVTCAVNKLIERGLVDADKVGVHGTSYGGYAASLLITQTDRFAAAVNISGKVNIISFLGDSPRIGHRNYAAAEVGQDRIGSTLWESPLKYIMHSAVMFADRITTPHLLITGEGDWNVPAGNTREMYYALRRLGKECVWVNYWEGGHGLSASQSKETYKDKWTRLIQWYQDHFYQEKKEDK
jgi:dipeptidyl aminopeptidase/acylaminoacyl peptidase